MIPGKDTDVPSEYLGFNVSVVKFHGDEVHFKVDFEYPLNVSVG